MNSKQNSELLEKSAEEFLRITDDLLLEKSAEKFKEITGDFFDVVRRKKEYRRIRFNSKLKPNFYRHIHYEFRYSPRDGVTAEFHIEHEKYKWIVESLQKKQSFRDGKLEFTDWRKYPGRIRVFPKYQALKQASECVSQAMINLIDGLQKEIANLVGRKDSAEADNQVDRIKENFFKGNVVLYWEGKCCLTKCEDRSALKVSRIKPRSEPDNQECFDVYNGLLLSPDMDDLFNKGLISFEDSGKIKLSDPQALGLRPDMSVIFEKYHIPYIKWHRENKFKKSTE